MPDLIVYHENDEVGFLDAEGDLGAKNRLEFMAALRDPTVGVNDRERIICQKRMPVFAITGRVTGGVGEGISRFNEPVEQGTFADVRAANDCDSFLHSYKK